LTRKKKNSKDRTLSSKTTSGKRKGKWPMPREIEMMGRSPNWRRPLP